MMRYEFCPKLSKFLNFQQMDHKDMLTIREDLQELHSLSTKGNMSHHNHCHKYNEQGIVQINQLFS